jgi:hypothetical protein
MDSVGAGKQLPERKESSMAIAFEVIVAIILFALWYPWTYRISKCEIGTVS